MTHFEYISVMVSIIMGLGVVRLLGSLDKVFSEHHYWPHTVWILTVFWLHVQNWWAFWDVRTVSFNVGRYSIFVGYASLLYLTTVALTNRRSNDTPWKEHFFAQRRWFFGVLILAIIMAIFITRLFFGASLLHPYRFIQYTLLGMAILAAVSDREKLHKVISILAFVLIAVGISAFRYLPDLFQNVPEY